MIQLEPVTKDNFSAVLALTVREEQQAFVSSPAESLAQAYVWSRTAYPFAVCDNHRVVGFIMMGYYEDKGYYTLWKLLIGRDFQRRGYGRKALELGIAFLREQFGVSEVYTGVAPGNAVAKSLYRSAGFRDTGLIENNMEEMCLKCRERGFCGKAVQSDDQVPAVGR